MQLVKLIIIIIIITLVTRISIYPQTCPKYDPLSQLSSSSISPAYARKLLQDKRVQGYLKSVASNPKMNISYSTPEDIL